VSIPIPFAADAANLVSANVFALGTGPLILIDTGPKVPGALDYLESALREAGFGFGDIETILLTHGHVDHFGLVQDIRNAANKRIGCFLHPYDRLHASPESFESRLWDKGKEDFLLKAGTPPQEIQKTRSRFDFFRSIADPLEYFSTLKDGDVFTGEGYHLSVIHTPGHTPGSCCFFERNRRILFSGDVIIRHITPNPLVELKKDFLGIPGYRSLRAYVDSLHKIEALGPDYVFPGHGLPVEGLPGLIAMYRNHHRQRMDRILEVLEKKPGSIYEMLPQVFPKIPKGETFLAVSDLYAHLELLVEDGKAALLDPGPPEIYGAVHGPSNTAPELP